MREEGKDEKAEKGKWPQRHFCVIYIDGRLYVGIKGKGEPCLMEMMIQCTGISSQMGTKLRDWAVRQAKAGCYSRAAMSSKDSKTLHDQLCFILSEWTKS